MNVSFYTFAGHATPAVPLRDKKGRMHINPQQEAEWLRQNPQHIARIHRFELPLGGGLAPDLGVTIPTFVFSVRVFDIRQNEGWRLATFALPASAHFNWEADVTLDDAWGRRKAGTTWLNEFVLQALDEAAHTGAGEFGAILKLLVLPEVTALDPDGAWAADFQPYTPAA